jgi:hypothetical protein
MKELLQQVLAVLEFDADKPLRWQAGWKTPSVESQLWCAVMRVLESGVYDGRVTDLDVKDILGVSR